MTLDRRGYTLVEIMVTAGIAAVLMAVFVSYLPKLQIFFRRLQTTAIMQSESRNSFDTMIGLLRTGKASSVRICACNNDWCTVPACVALPSIADDPVSSQIDFSTQDGHLRRFYYGYNRQTLQRDQTLRMDDCPTGVVVPACVTSDLARHVTNVTFGEAPVLGSPVGPGDFAVLTVGMTMSLPVENATDSSQAATIALPTQTVRLLTTN